MTGLNEMSVFRLALRDAQKWVLMLFMAVTLVACGGGESTESVPEPVFDTNASTEQLTQPYAGPVAASAEVLRFQTEFFNQYRAENRCGGCHGDGGQVPQFVRSDDINLAYAQALTVVDTDNPAGSRLVQRVGAGHHCWSTSDALCAADMEQAIRAWLNEGGAALTQILLSAPQSRAITESKQLPQAGAADYSATVTAYASSVYPLFTTYGCNQCHRGDAATPQQPYFVSSDLEEAYDNGRSKIDLADGEIPRTLAQSLSRFIVRLRSEFHNCGDQCQVAAADFLSAITTLSGQVTAPEIPANWLSSSAVVLELDGVPAAGGGRVENGIIASWDFSEGEGWQAGDRSGVAPALTLNLSGDVTWVGGHGIRIGAGGRAQGLSASSSKLARTIQRSGAYSVEAWVAPANVTQEGPARIISYSASDDERNFTLGQVQYNYSLLQRSSTTDANGEPALMTPDDDEVLQATLQHVVATFDPINGRRLYVNGQLVSTADDVEGGLLSNWDDSFVLIMGSETSGDDGWEGIIRYAAIYDRAISADDVLTNYAAGVGEKYYLLFDVSPWMPINDDFASFVVFETSLFDSYSYLFNQPFFFRLPRVSAASDAVQASYNGIALEGIRIGVNGREPEVGQGFARLKTTLSSAAYGADAGQPLARSGTIIAIESGAMADEFFLNFEHIGHYEDVRVEGVFSPTLLPGSVVEQPAVGLRLFSEANATLAKITGVPATHPEVAVTYAAIQAALPTAPGIEAFVSAQQMALTQLAIEYCTALVDDTSLRAAFFPGFDFEQPLVVAFDGPSERRLITDPIYQRSVGYESAREALAVDVTTELDSLLQMMSQQRLNDADATNDGIAATRQLVQAACAAGLGSALTLMQ